MRLRSSEVGSVGQEGHAGEDVIGEAASVGIGGRPVVSYLRCRGAP